MIATSTRSTKPAARRLRKQLSAAEETDLLTRLLAQLTHHVYGVGFQGDPRMVRRVQRAREHDLAHPRRRRRGIPHSLRRLERLAAQQVGVEPRLVGVEPAFHDETTGDVPMEGLDVPLALRRTAERHEMSQRRPERHPLAGAHARCRHCCITSIPSSSRTRSRRPTAASGTRSTCRASPGSSFSMPPPSGCPSSSQLSRPVGEFHAAESPCSEMPPSSNRPDRRSRARSAFVHVHRPRFAASAGDFPLMYVRTNAGRRTSGTVYHGVRLRHL